jgi:2-oxoisovalerate dehydrogenase E1 component alpha subunit
MHLTREFDTRALRLQRQGRTGFYVPCTGEEALQIGSAAALNPEDWIYCAYREPGAALFRGMPLFKLICQLYGNAEDSIKGRQMPSHFGWRGANFVPASSPVGTQIPQCMGAAWAAKIKKEDAVFLTYFGDGATSEGDFHVGMNFAGVHKLPVIFFCKNNQYAISCPASKQTASATFAIKAVGYGFEGVRVDGNDALAVYKVTKEAVDKARGGGGPTMIEAVSYRMGPHSTADDVRRYRSEKEAEEWKQKDPLLRFKLYLESKGLWSEAQEHQFIEQTMKEVDETIRAAEEISPPPVETMFEEVYRDMPWHLQEQLQEAKERTSRAHVESAPTWGSSNNHQK